MSYTKAGADKEAAEYMTEANRLMQEEDEDYDALNDKEEQLVAVARVRRRPLDGEGSYGDSFTPLPHGTYEQYEDELHDKKNHPVAHKINDFLSPGSHQKYEERQKLNKLKSSGGPR